MSFFFLTQLSIITYEINFNYETFSKQKELFNASEVLVTSVSGLAIYEENTVKHHELDANKLKSDYCVSIKSKKINIECDHSEIIVRRFALCNGDPCVIKIS